jgi:TP901 family phage tail tape measure protein
MAHAFKMDETVRDLWAVEEALKRVQITGELSDKELSGMDKQLNDISVATNQFKKDLVSGMNVFASEGFETNKALGYMTTVGKFSKATGASIEDSARLGVSLGQHFGIAADKVGKAYDVMDLGAKKGSFEAKDMAGEFSALGASAKYMGLKGIEGVASVTAALEIARRGAGSSSEAANNMKNFMSALTKKDVQENMKKFWGKDLVKITDNAKKKGLDPILTVMDEIKKSTGGDVNKLSEVFRDAQVANFIKPMLSDLEDYKKMKKEALSADGVVDADYLKIMETSNQLWSSIQIKAQKITFEKLNGPLNAVNSTLTKIADNPLLADGIFNMVAGTIGVGVVTAGIGAVSYSVGTLTDAYTKVNSKLLKVATGLW